MRKRLSLERGQSFFLTTIQCVNHVIYFKNYVTPFARVMVNFVM